MRVAMATNGSRGFWRVLAVAALSLCLQSSARADAVDLSYTNWPADSEWVALTNHIGWCWRQMMSRYSLAGLSTSGIPAPTLTDPVSDYTNLATRIDGIAPYYVDLTKPLIFVPTSSGVGG